MIPPSSALSWVTAAEKVAGKRMNHFHANALRVDGSDIVLIPSATVTKLCWLPLATYRLLLVSCHLLVPYQGL